MKSSICFIYNGQKTWNIKQNHNSLNRSHSKLLSTVYKHG